jgi:glycosyltransferase involved in cell wall biosynthesis
MHHFESDTVPTGQLHVFVLIPSYFGCGGVVNERQLLNTMSQKVASLWVVTLVGFKQIFTKRRLELRVERPSNLMVIPIPIPEFNVFLVTIAHILLSFISAFLVAVLDSLRKIDLIYIRTSSLAFAFMLNASLRKITTVKITAIVEDELNGNTITFKLFKKLSSSLDKLTITHSNRVAVLDSLMGKVLTNRRAVRPKKPWLVLSAGVDLELAKDVRHSQKNYNKINNNYKIGFLGTLNWWQGADLIAKAITLVKEERPNIKFLIIGDGELKSSIENFCKSSNISCEITGFLPHEEALKRLATLDVLVLPRRRTPNTDSIIPIKVIEAWALGIPVIVTKHTVFLANHIRNYEEVIYCEPEPNSVATALRVFLDDDVLRNKLRLNGFLLSEKFDYNKIVDNILSL